MKGTKGFALAMVAAGLVGWLGCDKKPSATTNTASNATNSGTHTHADGTVHNDDHGHAHDDPDAGHHGAMIELGTETIGPFLVRASRDQGEIQAGGDAPIDVWLTAADGSAADLSKVIAVRFWIGTEKGESVKAKAEIENPDQPNHWHTHAEVPQPFPAGSKLWVEIEIAGVGKKYGSFDLKT